MNEDEVISQIVDGFEGVETVMADGDTFFFYKSERMFPFATVVTRDVDGSYSNLSRPGVYRLNIGVAKQTYQALFDADIAVDADHYDFTGLDTLLPHPIYWRQYWVSVLRPSQETFAARVRPLLAEAYEMAVRKHNKGQGTGDRHPQAGTRGTGA